MAYNVEKLAKLGALKELGLKQKAVDEAQNKRIKALEDVGAQANVLEGVKVNGVALAIAEKMVDILVATGSKNGSISVAGTDVAIKGLAALAYKAKISQSDLDDALAAVLAAKADKATTLGGYGITDAYTKDEINAAMKAAATESFGYNEDEIVSSDIIGMRFGSLFDATQTMVCALPDGKTQVQVVSWYDNENSYVSQMCRTIKHFATLL